MNKFYNSVYKSASRCMWQVFVVRECFVTAKDAHNGGTMACHNWCFFNSASTGVVLIMQIRRLYCSGEGGKK